MKLLAIDTSSDACSAAVLTDKAYEVVFELAPRAHTRLILPMVETVLAHAALRLSELDAIAFGRGPGAFTGVRIAVGVAQGLALAADKPVLPISSLAALAEQAYEELEATHVMVALDARMGEVYWGEYVLQDGRMCLQREESVDKPEAVPLPAFNQKIIGVGSGWAAYPVLQQRFEPCLLAVYADWLPSAGFVVKLARFDWQNGLQVVADLAQPVYLRNKVAQTTRERGVSSA
ncbi:MAG: tRNA (adenosine(37)-N6)-threonylcarbamoyltransferase complex dimerization subunit type 1 TsaB [Proteobacteria bacterium]|nr:MAG: tRNA (adenosine(37)-N6)-threonylcarbamoyltransferase complex dimerization subunit type 1 TsaB [Pseudomonadota bacterium]